MDGADALALVHVAELVGVAVAAAERERDTAADVVVVAPPGDRNAARTRVLRQRAHLCATQYKLQLQQRSHRPGTCLILHGFLDPRASPHTKLHLDRFSCFCRSYARAQNK